MIFPLLLAISRRLAALVPTALMSLAAIGAMLLFAKKAFLLSAAALAVSVYDQQRARRKEHHPFHESSLTHLNEAEIEWRPLPAHLSHVPHFHHRKASAPSTPSSYYIYKPSSYDVPIQPIHSHSQGSLSEGYGGGGYYRRRGGNYNNYNYFSAANSANAVNTVNDYTAAHSKVSSTAPSFGNHRDGSTSSSFDVVDDYVEVQHQHDSVVESSYTPDANQEQREPIATYYGAAPQQAAFKASHSYNRSGRVASEAVRT